MILRAIGPLHSDVPDVLVQLNDGIDDIGCEHISVVMMAVLNTVVAECVSIHAFANI